MLSIGDLSRRANIKVPTIRYYEQIGLIDPPERTRGNQRRYSDHAVERLGFIKHARDLGLSIEAIRELIEIGSDPEGACAAVDRIAERHLLAIREKISRLRHLERELERMITRCPSTVVNDCYVLRSLSNHDLRNGDHSRRALAICSQSQSRVSS